MSGAWLASSAWADLAYPTGPRAGSIPADLPPPGGGADATPWLVMAALVAGGALALVVWRWTRSRISVGGGS